jgi:hypothetical protein
MQKTMLLCQICAKWQFHFNHTRLAAGQLRTNQFHHGLPCETLLYPFFEIRLCYSRYCHNIPQPCTLNVSLMASA